MKSIAIDAGPLIDLFDSDGPHHDKVVALLANTTLPFVTNWLVIGEASYMLSFNLETQRDFISWACQNLELDEEVSTDSARILEIMKQCASLPADLADASLLAMCERRNIRDIATLAADFDVYRTKAKKPLRNVLLG